MSYSDDDSNLLNNNAHNYSYPYTSNIEAYRTEVSLPPPHFVGYVPNNIPTDDDNENDELNEEIYNFNLINNQNVENNNYSEELIEDKQEIFKNIETNKNGIGSTTREENTREKTKTIKNKKPVYKIEDVNDILIESKLKPDYEEEIQEELIIEGESKPENEEDLQEEFEIVGNVETLKNIKEIDEKDELFAIISSKNKKEAMEYYGNVETL